MKITLVEKQQKNQNRYNIYLDGKFAFGVDEDTLVEQRLIVGKELDEELLEKVLFESEVGALMARMYGLLSVRMRSEKEIRDYLRNLSFKRKLKDKDELSEVVIESLIKKLKEKDLINDERFAREWIEARRNSKNKGINAIKAELYSKGISREVIESKLDPRLFGDDTTLGWSEENEEDLATKALEKKVKNILLLKDVKEKQRILGFLMRKGFSYEIAREAIENKLKEL